MEAPKKYHPINTEVSTAGLSWEWQISYKSTHCTVQNSLILDIWFRELVQGLESVISLPSNYFDGRLSNTENPLKGE